MKYNRGLKLLLQFSVMKAAPALLSLENHMIAMIGYVFSSM